MEKRPQLYTNEAAVFRSRLKTVDLSQPITVIKDVAGNFAVVDGNHRAFVAEKQNLQLAQTVIGTIHMDVTTSLNFRPVSDLHIIEK